MIDSLPIRAFHAADDQAKVYGDLPDPFSPTAGSVIAAFVRVTTITDFLEHGVPLKDVQRLAGDAAPRTTRFYGRRG